MAKNLIRVVTLVQADTASESDARTIGGNIARHIQANLPSVYDVKGVEVEAVTPVDEDSNAAVSDNTAQSRRNGKQTDDKDKDGKTVLTT